MYIHAMLILDGISDAPRFFNLRPVTLFLGALAGERAGWAPEINRQSTAGYYTGASKAVTH